MVTFYHSSTGNFVTPVFKLRLQGYTKPRRNDDNAELQSAVGQSNDIMTSRHITIGA